MGILASSGDPDELKLLGNIFVKYRCILVIANLWITLLHFSSFSMIVTLKIFYEGQRAQEVETIETAGSTGIEVGREIVIETGKEKCENVKDTITAAVVAEVTEKVVDDKTPMISH